MSSRRGLRLFARWLAATAIVIAALVGLAILAVQIVLWQGEIPRQLVQDALEDETGLRVRIGALRSGWFGESHLEDLEVWLPLEDEPLARVPRATVNHTDLLRIIARRPVTIDKLLAENPVVILREDATGTWNVERAIEIIDRTQASLPASPQRRPSPLPNVRITGADLRVIRHDGAAAQAPLTLTGDAHANGSWTFTAEIPGRASLTGRIAASATWLHDVQFDVADIAEFARLWTPDIPHPLRAKGRWRGESRADGLAATVWLDEALAGEEHASGRLSLVFEGGRLRVEPMGLAVASPRSPVGAATLAAGTLHADTGSGDVRMEGLVANVAGASITVDGAWDARRRTAEARASWSGGLEPWNARQEAWLEAEAALPRAGLQSLKLRAGSAGRGFGGEWDAALSVSALGPTWEHMDAVIDADRLRWRDSAGVLDLAGARIVLTGDWPAVRVSRVEIPGARITAAEARYDTESGNWNVLLDISRWEIPRLGAGPITLSASAHGRDDNAVVEEFRIVAAGVAAEGQLAYTAAADTPLEGTFTARLGVEPDEFGAPQEHAGPLPAEAGHWRVTGSLTGGPSPLRVVARGHAEGRGIVAPGESLPPISFGWEAEYHDGEARVVTEPFQLADGDWQLRARYTVDDDAAAASVAIREAPLTRIARIFGVPLDVAGALTADVEVLAPGLDASRAVVQGGWTVDRLGTDAWGVDRGHGRIRTRRGRVDFEDITLELGEGRVLGRMGFNLQQMHRLDVSLRARDWPIALQDRDIRARVSATADLVVDVLEGAARGRVEASTPLYIGQTDYAQLFVGANLAGRTVIADTIRLRAAGGELTGNARVPVDDWRQGTAELVWQGLDVETLLRPLINSEELLQGLTGRVAGTLTAGPTDDHRALEPFRVDVTLAPEGAGWRTVEVGPTTLTVWVGADRWLLDEAKIEVAGGTLAVWSRLRWHDGEPFAQIQTTFQNLSMVDLIAAVDPDASPSAGKLSGRLTFGGYMSEPYRAFGAGRVRIHEADLAAMPGISQLYSLLNLRIGAVEATGEGEADIRLEDHALILRELRYFNRGTDVIASARLDDLRLGADSPISGFAVGRVRPLRGVGLPFMRDLDEIVSAVQTGGASVRVGGTLSNRQIRPAPFEEVGAYLRGIFGGE